MLFVPFSFGDFVEKVPRNLGETQEIPLEKNTEDQTSWLRVEKTPLNTKYLTRISWSIKIPICNRLGMREVLCFPENSVPNHELVFRIISAISRSSNVSILIRVSGKTTASVLKSRMRRSLPRFRIIAGTFTQYAAPLPLEILPGRWHSIKVPSMLI